MFFFFFFFILLMWSFYTHSIENNFFSFIVFSQRDDDKTYTFIENQSFKIYFSFLYWLKQRKRNIILFIICVLYTYTCMEYNQISGVYWSILSQFNTFHLRMKLSFNTPTDFIRCSFFSALSFLEKNYTKFIFFALFRSWCMNLGNYSRFFSLCKMKTNFSWSFRSIKKLLAKTTESNWYAYSICLNLNHSLSRIYFSINFHNLSSWIG